MIELFGTLRDTVHTTIPVHAQTLNEMYTRLSVIENMAEMAAQISSRQDDDEQFLFSRYHVGTLHLAMELLGKDGSGTLEDLEVAQREANK